MCEHVSGNSKAGDGERASKGSGERELEDATGQLKAGNEVLQKLLRWTQGGKRIGRRRASS